MTGATLFDGDRSGCGDYCRGRAGFYVYILKRPDGRPFYVGKGTGGRVAEHENEARHPNGRRSNAHKLNVIRASWRRGLAIGYAIDSWHEGEQAAYDREAQLIRTLRRLHEGGPLTNRAAGGGSAGSPSPFSRARHSATLAGAPEDNPERATLNRFVLSIGGMESVVIKPAGQFAAKPTQRYPAKSISLKPRTAVAVAAAAAAQGLVLRDGATFARQVVVDGVEGLLENGVCCDLLTAGVIEIIQHDKPSHERLRLCGGTARRIAELVGVARCVELGIYDG